MYTKAPTDSCIQDSGFMEPEFWTQCRVSGTLARLEGVLNKDNVDSYLKRLSSAPHILQIFLSGASDGLFSFVSNVIERGFPSAPGLFKDSTSSIMLSQLSLSLFFLTFPADFAAPSNLADCRRSVELSIPVLDALPFLTFQTEDHEPETIYDDDDMPFKVTQKSQSKNKKHKKPKKPVNDEAPFRNLGVDVPCSPQEAEKLGSDILADQKGILLYYLEILRRPGLGEYLPRLYDTEREQKGVKVDVDSSAQGGQNDEHMGVPAMESAYPIVQPMKAALYFESAKGLGDWHIFVSTRADRDLRAARKKDPDTFKIIAKKIGDLSKGHFSKDNQKRLTGPSLDVPIYEAKMTGDLRLVYQIDCIPEFDSDIERQVIKIFGIYTHAQMDNRLWEYVGHQLSGRGKEYRRRCIFRNKPLNSGDNVIPPASFPPQSDGTEESSQILPQIPQNYLQEIHSILVLEKFVTLSQAFLNSILADRDVAHVFAVSPYEREIIEHTSSCYVIGRSGTGKTTTMLFKMLGIQRSWEQHSFSMPKPRQIFVTRSPILAVKVEEYFTKLLKSLGIASSKPRDLVQGDDIAGDLQVVRTLADLDENAEWRVDLPKRFSLLRPEHFPLFISFDHLCSMLEGDFGQSISASREVSTETHSTTDEIYTGGRQPVKGHDSMVSYDKFLEEYWPHLPQALTKGLDPALVFNEIMGVIKGSEKSLHDTRRYLDRSTYCALSHRSQSTFVHQRDLIYDIFECYQKLRSQRREYDDVDRTHHILMQLEMNDISIGEQVDFLYVDEVQDNHLIDTYLLRRLCKNPNGMFWAGDTAQTISIGSSFKFNDLKAFLHRLEFANHVEARLKSRSTVTYSPEPPRTFQLAINYRSHAGIVRCAHSIVELITRFWPHSIDSLGEEKGIVEGLRPIFFGCSDLDTVRYEQFLFGESAARIEFGARQCILVRNETAKDELRQHVGDIGVILTLYESKGLEFDDVLLYNFFADSSCTLSQWRMILAVVVEIGPSARAPTFNEVRHAGICNELKFLYVAVTRARNNLWIYDPSDKAQPMQTFWSTNGCIDLYTSKMELPKLAVSSTPEEWSGTGWSLFENRRYYQAMHCFQRAGLKYETDIASAYHLRDHARSIHSLASARSKAFMEAADAFVGVAAASNQPRDRLTYMKNAAQCYVLAEDVRKAAQAFLDAEEFTLAASQYQKAGLFDEAIEVIRTTQVEADIAGTICHTARLFYLQKKRLKQAATLFDSVEDELCFMEDFGFDDVRADVLESMDKHAEAAAIHLEEGQLFDGIRLLLKDRTDPLAQQRAKEHLKDCFWQIMSLDCDDVILDAGRIGSEQLLHWTRQIEETTGRHGLDDEMRMFKAISSGDYVSLERLGHMLARSNLKAAAFLCFTHVFRPCSLIPTMSAKEASGFLSSFVTYTELLRHVATHQAPHISKSISKLFGFRLEPQGSVLLPKGTFFHKVSSRKKSRVLGSNDDGIRLSEAQFLGLYKHSLAGYALDIVLEEDNHWQELKALRPCLALVAFGRCNAEDVCPKDHVPTSRLRADAYNTRVRLCLQQVLVLSNLHFIPCTTECRVQRQRAVLLRLHEALYPSHPLLGGISDLERSQIPEARTAITALRHCLQVFFSPRLDAMQDEFLVNFAWAASLTYFVDGAQACQYLSRAPTVKHFTEGCSRLSASPLRLLRFLENTERTSTLAGTLFLREAGKMNVPMDVNLLCNFMESLCGTLVLCRNYQNGNKHTLHGVTLPRNWLLTLMPTIADMQWKDTRYLREFSEAMVSMLDHIIFAGQRSRFIFEGRDFSNCGGQVKNAFIARICRCMCLLGYNVRDDKLRDQILRDIVSRKPNYVLPALCARYFEATTWEGLTRVLRGAFSTTREGIRLPDRLVQLHDVRHPAPSRSVLQNVQKLVYKNVDDICNLLLVTSGSSEPALLRPNAESFTPRASVPGIREGISEGPAAPADDAEEDLQDIPEEVAPDIVEEGLEANEDIGGEYTWANTITPERIRAVTIIQTAYRNVRRRQRMLDACLSTRTGRLWRACSDIAQSTDSMEKRYRSLFLGPFVHALLCLEVLYSYASLGKDGAKKRFKKAQHQELEETSEQMTHFRNLLRQVIDLQKELQPKSDFHRQSNASSLVARMSDIQRLVHEIRDQRQPLGVVENCDKRLDRALEREERRKQQPKREPLPQLVLDDESDLFNDVW